ncbi:MAG: lysine exporter LysO family protein, partial [Muribaculaceae bacterium]|nr:lysine exporter LysO family protein [Muribaculaceae bacterium]
EVGSFGFDVSFVALAMLMFCVGIGVGSDLGALRNLRTLDSRLLLLPLVTIIGTLAGCLLLGLVMPRREIPEVLAVGSGFGYYSLSSIFITQYKGAELGTVALLANISREIITLLGAPLLMRLAGPLAPISSGGATTMDTTLPIISNVSGKDFVILSIYHGFVVDFSVPFLVTFFCSI